MTTEQAAAIVARQLTAEARYLAVVGAIPAIRAEHRRILEEAERELEIAAAEVLASGVTATRRRSSGTPDGCAGSPDG